MLKNVFLGALVMCGAAVFAEDQAAIYFSVKGDVNATIEVENNSSAAVKFGGRMPYVQHNSVQRAAFVMIEGEDPVEVEIQFTPSVSGTSWFDCQGWGEDRKEHAYIDCVRFEVDGKTFLPSEKFPKGRTVYGPVPMLPAPIEVEAGKPVKVKAVFIKVTGDRLEQLTAAAERQAAAKKAREAKKAEMEAKKDQK